MGILIVELYRKVRLARRGGMSERAAAVHFGVSRASVKKIMGFSVPPGYRRTAVITQADQTVQRVLVALFYP